MGYGYGFGFGYGYDYCNGLWGRTGSLTSNTSIEGPDSIIPHFSRTCQLERTYRGK